VDKDPDQLNIFFQLLYQRMTEAMESSGEAVVSVNGRQVAIFRQPAVPEEEAVSEEVGEEGSDNVIAFPTSSKTIH